MTPDSQVQMTQLLRQATSGDDQADARLMAAVYEDLREQARRFFQQEAAGHTLQPTALVNEAYLRLIKQSDATFHDRRHFCAIAAQMMRRVLVDHARSKGRVKRGSGRPRVSFDERLTLSLQNEADVLTLNDAIDALARLDSRQAEIVQLRFFGGLTVDEVADVVGASERTVRNDWRVARAWLRRELSEDADE